MNDPTAILNWRRHDSTTTLSGQPTEAQLAHLAATGVTHILNLGPHTNKGALPDEPGSVARLGMTYTYIPVDFENPTEQDFDAFRTALAATNGQTRHVHCIYNARVSAFFYRYAQSGHGDTAAAFALMDSIWRPGGIWAKFIGDAASTNLPNRYAGTDY